jgi:hypothetical protein
LPNRPENIHRNPALFQPEGAVGLAAEFTTIRDDGPIVSNMRNDFRYLVTT